MHRGQLYCACKFSQNTTEVLNTAAHMTNKTFIVSILETHNKKGVQFVSSVRAQSWDYTVTKLQPRGTLGIDSKMKSPWHQREETWVKLLQVTHAIGLMAKAHKCHKTLLCTVWGMSVQIPGVSKEKLVNCLKSAAMEFNSLSTSNTRAHVLY